MPKLNGVIETALYVDDLPRAREFYQDILGLRAMNSDARFAFTLEVMLAPEVTLPDYKGLSITVPKAEVSEEHIAKVLENQRERLARLHDPELDAHGVAYTRRVTIVWCGFFILNGGIALATALWASEQTWALYNGFITYALMGLLMGGEWLVRRRVRAGKHVA